MLGALEACCALTDTAWSWGGGGRPPTLQVTVAVSSKRTTGHWGSDRMARTMTMTELGHGVSAIHGCLIVAATAVEMGGQ